MKFFDDSREVKRQMAAAARPDARAAYQPIQSTPKDNQSLVLAGWITLGLGAFFWPLLLVAFILGIILAAKGSVGHGVAIMVLTFVAPLAGLAVLFA